MYTTMRITLNTSFNCPFSFVTDFCFKNLHSMSQDCSKKKNFRRDFPFLGLTTIKYMQQLYTWIWWCKCHSHIKKNVKESFNILYPLHRILDISNLFTMAMIITQIIFFSFANKLLSKMKLDSLPLKDSQPVNNAQNKIFNLTC